jgi:large subunit ribosomal protein L1
MPAKKADDSQPTDAVSAAPSKAVTKKTEPKPKKATAAKKTVSKKSSQSGLKAPLRGKRYAAAAEKVDREKLYNPEEGVALARETATTKFDATIELHLKLGVDPRKAEENIRGTVKLPAGTGKILKVMAFVAEGQHAEAKKAGADFVSDEATLKKLDDGWADFDVAVATPDQMPTVAKFGKALGPKGLMPNPKAGTVTDKPADAIAEVKKGMVEYRVAKDATVHVGIGKASFKSEDLLANVAAYYQAILGAKPSDLKGTYIKSITITSTMGPGIKLDPEALKSHGGK